INLPYVFLMALSSLHAKVTASPFEGLLMGNACNNQPSILKVSPSVCLPVKRNAEGGSKEQADTGSDAPEPRGRPAVRASWPTAHDASSSVLFRRGGIRRRSHGLGHFHERLQGHVPHGSEDRPIPEIVVVSPGSTVAVTD